jgi:hypothetical protein
MENSAIESTGALAALSGSLNDARTDARQRVIVDAGIAVQGSSNTMSAVEYLRTRDIRSHVIERVLLEPHRRRSGS